MRFKQVIMFFVILILNTYSTQIQMIYIFFLKLIIIKYYTVDDSNMNHNIIWTESRYSFFFYQIKL